MRLPTFCFVLLVAGSSVGAAATRRECKEQCVAAVEACVAGGAHRRGCRRQLVKRCRKEGTVACVGVPATTSTTTSTTTDSGATTTTTSPSVCVGGVTDCGPGRYCNAPGCGGGSCEAIADVSTERSDYMPVCGCNGLTYWNASIAENHGVALRATDVCSGEGAKYCVREAQVRCPVDTQCLLRLVSQECQMGSGTGPCVVMPQACPPVPLVRSCGFLACVPECVVVKTGLPILIDFQCQQ